MFHSIVQAQVEVVRLEDDSFEDTPKSGPKSAISLQNLLIDNPDLEEKEVPY